MPTHKGVLPKKIKVGAGIGVGIWLILIIYIITRHYFAPSLSVELPREDAVHRDVVNVCMSSDESQLIGLVAAMNSVYKNSKHPVKFHILVTKDAYYPLIRWIKESPTLKNIMSTVEVFDVSRITSKIQVHDGRPELAHPMNYARFYYTEFFPELKGRAVHIDVDCIVQGDIGELAGTSLAENQTAAFSDDCVSVTKRLTDTDRAYFKYINFTNPHIRAAKLDPMECSFNTGVYVFHADRWREQNITSQLDYWMTLNTQERVYANKFGGGGSQPPMMIVFYRQHAVMNPLWNLRHLGTPSASSHYTAELIASAKLLHWSGPIKPWHGQASYSKLWDVYFLPDPKHKYKPVRKYGGNS